jgi:hypothetical protein
MHLDMVLSKFLPLSTPFQGDLSKQHYNSAFLFWVTDVLSNITASKSKAQRTSEQYVVVGLQRRC